MQSSPVQECAARGEVAHLQEVVMEGLGRRVVGVEVVRLDLMAWDELMGAGIPRGSEFLVQTNQNEHAESAVP